MLEAGGYHVTMTNDPSCAVDLAIETRPDIIVTDVIMPGLSGPQVVDLIRAAGIESPVVFISGYTEDRISGQGMDIRDYPLLRKPFSRAELLTTVARELGYERE